MANMYLENFNDIAALEEMDLIESKLGQAKAITSLLSIECDSGSRLNDELRAYALEAITDLIDDSKKLFWSVIKRERDKG